MTELPPPLVDADRPFYGRDPRAEYFPEPALIEALNAAIVLGMPLLLTGDPGCGKTDFAFAIARRLAGEPRDWQPFDHAGDGLLECYIRSDTTARDLLYHYDALRRFGDAHHGGPAGAAHAADPRHYIELMPLGVALAQIAADPPRRRVVLVDEIDKAPRDLPNDLLRELDQGRFEIRELPEAAAPDPITRHGVALRRHLGQPDPASHQRPVIIITSNEERQLPDPFLRRCVFHHVEFPPAERLDRILRARFGPRAPDAAYPAAIKSFLALRAQYRSVLLKTPSTSELIAWFEALVTPGVYRDAVPRLTALADAIRLDDKGALCLDARKRWTALPGLGCLLKLKADWDRVSAAR